MLVTYGAQTEEISEQAKLKGFSAENSYHFTDIDDYTDKDQLNALLKRIVKKDDTILVKGASKTNMYEIVRFLKQKFR